MQLKQLFILTLCVTGISFSAVAQQKTAYVNSEKVIAAMPEYKQMNDSMDVFKSNCQNTLDGMYAEYEKKQKKLQELDVKVQDSFISELQELQQRIQGYEKMCSDDIDKQQQAKSEPIKEKFSIAVQQVAQTQGYNCVIDLSSGVIVYFTDTTNDITGLVLTKLGITGGQK